MTGRPGSLSTRLLVITGLMLVATFAVTIAVLEFVFRQSAEQALGDQLETQVFALIGAAEPDEAGKLAVPERLLEPRLRNPGSGLYAQILDAAGLPLWRSPSAVGLDLGTGTALEGGQRLLTRRVLPDGSEVFLLGIGINWEIGSDQAPAFQVFAAMDLADYRAQLKRFHRQLLGWFSGVMIVLLAALWFALRSGLDPLRRMSAELASVESGARPGLGEDYPRELAGVARGLNTLLRSERQRMDRYRTTMDDLAHSLKTPLAVMGSELGAPAPDGVMLHAQVKRMQDVVAYQLRRAAATGPRSIAARAVAIAPIAAEIVASLQKIYREKAVTCDLPIPANVACAVEQGDLYEIIGNVLDNAWKWCVGRVVVTVMAEKSSAAGTAMLVLTIADDGPGIPADQSAAVLARGIRGDERGDVPGQGIGLAVVGEIVGLYGGTIAIARSVLGGAEISLRLPVAGD